jgi:hypothetical protein
MFRSCELQGDCEFYSLYRLIGVWVRVRRGKVATGGWRGRDGSCKGHMQSKRMMVTCMVRAYGNKDKDYGHCENKGYG